MAARGRWVVELFAGAVWVDRAGAGAGWALVMAGEVCGSLAVVAFPGVVQVAVTQGRAGLM